MLAVVISVVVAGRIVSMTGRYWYFLVLGPIPGAIGAGLLYTVSPTTANAKIIGYQSEQSHLIFASFPWPVLTRNDPPRLVLVGVGVGTTMQNGLFAMQAEFRDNMRLVAQATGLASFSQFLGGTISLAIGQAALSTQLTKNFGSYAPDVPLQVIAESPLKIWDLPADEIQNAVVAYVKSLQIIFIIPVAYFVLGIACALFIKNISIKKPKEDSKPKEEAGTAPVLEKATVGGTIPRTEKDVEAGIVEGEVARAEGA
jgi:MFS family permease